MRARRRLVTSVAAVALSLSLAVPAIAAADYGAIAINRATGAWGVSYNRPSVHNAERGARAHCRGYCHVMVWVRNRCAAVVETQTRFVAGIGTTRSRAVRSARHRAGDHFARRVAWVCSG